MHKHAHTYAVLNIIYRIITSIISSASQWRCTDSRAGTCQTIVQLSVGLAQYQGSMPTLFCTVEHQACPFHIQKHTLTTVLHQSKVHPFIYLYFIFAHNSRNVQVLVIILYVNGRAQINVDIYYCHVLVASVSKWQGFIIVLVGIWKNDFFFFSQMMNLDELDTQ